VNELEKRRDDYLIKKIEKRKNIVVDRPFNLILPGDPEKLEIIGNLNYKTRMVHDVYSNLLFRENVLSMPRLEEKMFGPEDLEEITENFLQMKSIMPSVIFSDSEFRDTLGLSSNAYPNRKVSELVDDYANLRIRGTFKVFWDGTDWQEISFRYNPFAEVFAKKALRPVGHWPETSYLFRMTVAGCYLFQNFNFHQVNVFSQNFYRMSPGSQDFYRHISQWMNKWWTLQEISRIMGLKEEVENIWVRIKQVEKHLEEIRKAGLIQDYRPKGEKEDRVYFIPRFLKRVSEDELKQLKEHLERNAELRKLGLAPNLDFKFKIE